MRINKKIKITKASQAILQIAIMIIATFAFAFLISAPRAEAAVQADYCCEKTDVAKYGRAAWCVNTKQENCDANYKNTPSSCDATSFCKPGCCYESGEGLCMENSPQLVCNQNNGSWSESAECEIPQCKLGCCVLDNQAALVTLSRCKRLSGIYGMPIDFITNIQDEVQCIALTQLKDRGACVYEEDFIAKCKFTTRELCQGIKSTGNLTASRFHKDKLCSDPDLGTICGMPDESNVKTTCIEGKDEVYFVDTCGNPANIYDASKVKEPSYWKEVVDKSESCGTNSANANSKDCGNCDYYLGSICRKSERINRASYGDYMCQDLNCYDTSDGKDHKHGESWCSYDGNTGEGADSVGSRHFRHLCVGGEEIIEACEDYRKETCIETTTKISSGEFQEAACRGNRWTDCIAQDEKEDCENTDKRDCYWIEGISFPKEITQQVKEETSEEESGESGLKIGGGACLPNVPPGLKFWEENSPECSVANTQCIVTFEKGVFSEEEATDNKECLTDEWAKKMNQVCSSLGDCGGYVNWQGKYTDDGYKWKVDGKKKTISQGIVNEIKKKAGVSGKVVEEGTNGKGINGLIIGLAKAGSWLIPGGLAKATNGVVAPNLIYPGGGGAPYWELGVGGPRFYTEAEWAALQKAPTQLAKPAGGGIFKSIFGEGLMAEGSTSAAIITTATYALGAYFIGYMIGGMLGLDDDQTDALSVSLALGAGTWQGLTQFTETFAAGTGGATTAFWIGVAVAAVAFILLYKEKSQKVVTFECKPWQAPTKGDDCEKCNLEGENEPCSEYRCKSLGQGCELLNPGTTEEKCAWKNPRDVISPRIETWKDVLTKGYSYQPDSAIRPPARGVKIIKDGATDGCVKAFTPLEFGITTDEPAQCKIDYNHTKSFDEMAFYFGESNLYLYNHTQILSLPSPATINAVAPELKHDGTYTLYARCRDTNENENVDEFAIRFCVEPGPDTTPPEIKDTSIANNMPIKYNQSSTDLEVYVNEPSECKWSHDDKAYKDMENSMTCATNVWEMNNKQTYTCETTLTGLKDRQENKFYFRCKDHPEFTNDADRNSNQQSYKYTIIGTQNLNIIKTSPNGTIYDSTDVVPVFLEVETANGYKNGEAICSYSTTQDEKDYIAFLYETNKPTNLHKQRQDLVEGDYTYYIKCVDLGGNRDDEIIEFTVDIDKGAPAIARAYKENDNLKIVTIEESTCSYSSQDCNFDIADGVNMPYADQEEHVAEWRTETSYYIRCKDRYGNQPLSNECSMIIRPYDVLE